jgi:IclR family pca regulon transcriptional regulator
MSEQENSDKKAVQSLRKGLRLLEAVARSDESLTLSQISSASGLDPGTCFRMLHTLVEDGYLAKLDDRRFGLTLKVLDLGYNAIARRDVRTLVRPVLRGLVDETSEAASFAVLHGNDVLYVERVRAGLTRLGVDIRIGTTVPVVSSVLGLCLLAFTPQRRIDAVLQTIAAGASPSKADITQTLTKIRHDGFYLDDSFYGNGLRVLAAPVLDADGQPLGAISVAAPSMRTSAEDLREIALAPLMSAVKDLARGLEASGAALDVS